MEYSDSALRKIFEQTKTIALVGASANPLRPSHSVARYLGQQGFRVIPVNPGLAGQELLGEVVYGRLSDVPDDVEMVDIFRRPEAVPGIVDDALARWPKLQTIWMQIGITHAQSAAKAAARGVRVIQDRCTKIEDQRLSKGLRMGDLSTDINSAPRV